MDKHDLEEGLEFSPRFDDNGLIPCITTCTKTDDVLMFAFMNEQSLRLSIETGEAHYWSRSRSCLWHKGATSGYTQQIIQMRTDCDQDCIWISVKVNTPTTDSRNETACHTGRKSCFYREIEIKSETKDKAKMRFIDAEKLFNPKDVYKTS
ncbi:MAG: phosphoribosyl-AMP cyclohydrolase [Alphaproteobacteria bacterium]